MIGKLNLCVASPSETERGDVRPKAFRNPDQVALKIASTNISVLRTSQCLNLYLYIYESMLTAGSKFSQ